MFNESKDKRILEVKNEDTGLWLSLCAYNGGEPKVQIGPREIEKKDGSAMYVKAGRLSMEEVEWMLDVYHNRFRKAATLKPAEPAKTGG